MEETLNLAERATKWLETGGGWAMFILACIAMYLMVKYIKEQSAARLVDTNNFKDALASKIETLTKEHKSELAVIEKDHREQILAKDTKIFQLLDKTNELLKEIQRKGASS